MKLPKMTKYALDTKYIKKFLSTQQQITIAMTFYHYNKNQQFRLTKKN